MAIFEVHGGPITYRYLVNKTKHDLARMYLELLEDRNRLLAYRSHTTPVTVAMVDSAMLEMKNVHPPLRREECRRLLSAALGSAYLQSPREEPDIPTPEKLAQVRSLLNHWGLRVTKTHNTPNNVGKREDLCLVQLLEEMKEG